MIKKDQFTEVIEDFFLIKSTSFKASGDSGESKQVTLKVHFRGATIETLAQSCLGQGVVVKWQNGRARKDFDKIKNKSTVEIDWARPATAPQQDPMEVLMEKAESQGVDLSDDKAVMKFLATEMKKAQDKK
jgi:hypothetical protein